MVRVVLAVVALGCAVVSVSFPWSDVPRADPLWAVVGVGLVVVAALTLFARGRVVALIVSVVALGFAGWVLVGDLSSGVSGAGSAVLAVGALACVAGALSGWWGVPVLAVVLAVVAPFAVSTVDSATVDRADVGAVVARPAGVLWRWTAGAPVTGAVVAGPGIVVGTATGEVVSLTAGGGTTWRYARPGTSNVSLRTTPDRTLVVAAFEGDGPFLRKQDLWVLLDASTGEVVREWAGRKAAPTTPRPTDRVLVEWEGVDRAEGGQDFRITAVDLRGGQELWTWRAPEGCRAPLPVVDGAADTVLAILACGDDWGLVGLADRDGSERWRALSPVPKGESQDFVTDVGTDGRLVAVTSNFITGTLIRAHDGHRVATDLSSEYRFWAGTGPLAVGVVRDRDDKIRSVAVVDPGTGAVTPVAEVPCPRQRTMATTATTFLRLCDTEDGAELVWQDLDGTGTGRSPVPDWARPSSRSLGDFRSAFWSEGILPAPGFVALVRLGETGVVGFAG
ncbi:hypothetical protein GCM10022243_67410 [Saccharothrix violaceirubra]|uniref:Pyrroloquinoline-quinone binding quinoprotein n=1 Tax=Saccharothrix violaceirubra TaxID=413306 RepID=A0A7W7T2F3_9PSEU|nr:hypothetical protein [Saccharothrix violaceirubra]MBB4965308.1 hypothetical protein [Saccharothrix violaceirubra]